MARLKAMRDAAAGDVAKFARLMRENCVQRYRDGVLEIELHPSAFAAAPAPDAPAEKDPDTCACGHSLVTEHNPQGCLHGCDTATCNTTR